MKDKDFTVFSDLFSQVYTKAFCEDISSLPYGKAVSLSWMIYDATGVMLSYKSLCAYAKAVLYKKSESINPNDSTLGVLTRFVSEGGTIEKNKKELPLLWYQFRSQALKGSHFLKAG